MNRLNGRVELLPPRSRSVRIEEAPEISLQRFVRRPSRLGVCIIAIFVAGAFGWASLAPIATGAIAPGVISPDGSRRTVQHLEGGIIHAILVRDGDKVVKGQDLMVLQETQAAAIYEVLANQSGMLSAMMARLMAEQMESNQIRFPEELLASARADARVQAMVDGQVELFEKRRTTLRVQIELLQDRERQYQEQIASLTMQRASTEAQIELVAEEIDSKSQLFKKGLVPKPEVLRLQRVKAALEGDHGRFTGSIAEVRERIGEIATQRVSLAAERAQEVTTELAKVRTDLAAISERLAASRDILDRTVIIAPVSGKIVNSRFKTPGGVIRPGEAILDIVPTDERLLIDAHVLPSDIDIVQPGLDAVVHLTAYSNRGLPRIHGKVREVSADRIVDSNGGQAYFLARVEVSREDLERLGGKIDLVPGMPAEVMIVTGIRTTMGYLLEPFTAALRRGMRES